MCGDLASQRRPRGNFDLLAYFMSNAFRTEQALGQTQCIAIRMQCSSDPTRRNHGRSTPGNFPDVLPNSRGFRHISEANVTTKCYDIGFWEMPGRVSALLCLVAPQAAIYIESKRFACHTCPHTPFCTPIFCWMKSNRSEPLRTVISAEVSEFC
jgi:hypothetical protein